MMISKHFEKHYNCHVHGEWIWALYGSLSVDLVLGKVSKVMVSENAVFIAPVTSCELLRCDILTAVKINFTIFGYGIM